MDFFEHFQSEIKQDKQRRYVELNTTSGKVNVIEHDSEHVLIEVVGEKLIIKTRKSEELARSIQETVNE